MSDRPSMRLKDLARMGLIAASLVGSLSLVGSPVALAQDASPEASPMAECVPGEMSMGGMDMASPEASPMAEAEPVGMPADEATTAAATAFIDNIKACINDPEALATLVTPNLVMSMGGYASIEEAVADGFFAELPFGAMEVMKVTSYDNGAVGVEVQYQMTEYQIVAEEWWLVMDGDAWKLNAIENETADVDGDTVAVGVQLLEVDGGYAITPNTSSVLESEVLILQAINPAENTELHELVMVQLPEGADPMGLMDGSVAFEDVVFIGVVANIAPGDSADMTLVNLPAGQYTLLCFFPSPDGTPHIAAGMVAPFEVLPLES
ncbi:MAG: hypothetical protein M3Y37_10670 [Chloroflexota bacterium]|nr:hypothetical protein [Chloroflexota bacterium]